MATTEAAQRTDIGPEDIPRPGWKAILKRTVKEFQNDDLTDWGAALTYYAVLALFPALVVLVALVGLFGQYPQTTNALLNILRDVGVQSSTLDTLRKTINNVVQNKGGAGALLFSGFLPAHGQETATALQSEQQAPAVTEHAECSFFVKRDKPNRAGDGSGPMNGPFTSFP